MPKAAPNDRAHRALVRSMDKIARQLRQNDQKFTKFKKMALEKEKAYKQRSAEDANILRASLRNFSVPYYKQQKELLAKNEEVKKLENEIERLRANARKTLLSLRQAVQTRIKSRKMRSDAPGKTHKAYKYIERGSVDI
jgi:hypothetical protein